jgi:hypothetical protein
MFILGGRRCCLQKDLGRPRLLGDGLLLIEVIRNRDDEKEDDQAEAYGDSETPL